MAIPTFTPGYPLDGSSLGNTKATIRNNIDGTFQTLEIDHIDNNGNPGSQPAGYHKVIHQVTQTNVDTVTGVNQLFSGVPGTLVVNSTPTTNVPVGGDTQLYSLSGAGILSQLTGAVLATPGYVVVSGLLIQWGSFNNSTGTNPISFTPNFSSAPYFVIANSTSNNIAVKSFIKAVNQSSSGATVTLGNQVGAGFDAGGQLVQWLAVGPL